MGRPAFGVSVRRVFWRGVVRAGLSVADAAAAAGVSESTGGVWFRQGGGMSTVDLDEPSGRYLSFAERELIGLENAAGESQADIARQLGRSRSTICRELKRGRCSLRSAYDHYGSTRYRYVPSVAQAKADMQARRPKQGKLAGNARL